MQQKDLLNYLHVDVIVQKGKMNLMLSILTLKLFILGALRACREVLNIDHPLFSETEECAYAYICR